MKHLRPAITLTLFYIVATGLAFPALVTGIGQTVFPSQANGSLVKGPQGAVVGSALLGQAFARPEYLHPRPSAAGNGYDPTFSCGTNLGPTSAKLIDGVPSDPKQNPDPGFDGVKQLADAYRKENGLAVGDLIPVDAVTRSASGLDPHVSPRNAELQAPRIAKARGIAVDSVLEVIRRNTDQPWLGIFGDAAVNVLKVNLDLDRQR